VWSGLRLTFQSLQIDIGGTGVPTWDFTGCVDVPVDQGTVSWLW